MREFDRASRNQARILVIGNEESIQGRSIVIAKALASLPRMRILQYLVAKVASLSEIADDLDMPVATASLHLSRLEAAGLLSSQTAPGKRGQQRIYTRLYDSVVFNLPEVQLRGQVDHFEMQMPIAGFARHQVVPPCGLVDANTVIGAFDDPVFFYEPERFLAQLVWLSHGFLEYHFPNYTHKRDHPKSLHLSMEICSEAAPSAQEWPSDIFLEINGVRLGLWTSPADFGVRRGSLTPAWWPDWNSQYGLLKVWHVDERQSSIDGHKISDVTIRDLQLPELPYISVRIGIDDDAENKGGLNIFGRSFGNHPQDIVMQIDY